MIIPAFDLSKILRNPQQRSYWLRDALVRAPAYVNFASAAKHVIRCIHAIPDLYHNCDLGEIEVYVGRAGATEQHLLNRWRAHYDNKSHKHGIVALTCDTYVVDVWETAAVRAIKMLDSAGRLCVKNASASGQGVLPNTSDSCIYVTWKKTSAVALDTPRSTDVTRIAEEMASDLAVLEPPIAKDQLVRGFDPISRPTRERADICWHDDHAS